MATTKTMQAKYAIHTAMKHYQALTKDGKDYAEPIAKGLILASQELDRLSKLDKKLDGIVNEKKAEYQSWKDLQRLK